MATAAPITESAQLSLVAELNGWAYFGATDGQGAQIWRTDGTAEGTSKVATLASENVTQPFVRDIERLGDRLLMIVGDLSDWDLELWITDGTADGTLLLDEFDGVRTDMNSLERRIYAGSSKAYITGANSRDLIVTDGTPGGTYTYAHPEWHGRPAEAHGILGDQLLVFLYQASPPWVTDGTDAGTFPLHDVDTNYSTPHYSVEMNGRLYFKGGFGASTSGIWSTDGSASGTALAIDVTSLPVPGSARLLGTVGDQLILSARLAPGGGPYYLWASDGTNAGTHKLFDLPLTLAYSWPDKDSVFLTNNEVRAILQNASGAAEIWATDEKGAAGRMLGRLPGVPVQSVWLNDDVFLYVVKEAPGIWRFDASSGQSTLLENLGNRDFAWLFHATIIDGIAYFPVDDAAHGSELWRSDGTGSGTYLVRDINTVSTQGTSHTVTQGPFLLGGRLVYGRVSDTGHHEVVQTDGTFAGTTTSEFASNVVVHRLEGGSTYLTRSHAFSENVSFFKSTGNGLQGRPVNNFSSATYAAVGSVAEDDQGKPRFAATALSSHPYSDYGNEIWGMLPLVHDPEWGAAAPIKDIVPGPGGSFPAELTHLLLNRTVFLATDAAGVRGLWVTDGTANGTQSIQVLPVTASTATTRVGDVAVVTNLADGEWWVTDGTSGGTRKLADSPASGDVITLRVGQRVYAVGQLPAGGQAIWELVGSGADVSVVRLGEFKADSIGEFAQSGSHLYFIADTGRGSQIYVVGENDEAPRQITQLPSGADPAWLNPLPGGGVYFAAYDSAHGRELWFSDETAEGTGMAMDVLPGPASSTPESIAGESFVMFTAMRANGRREIVSTFVPDPVANVVSVVSSQSSINLLDARAGGFELTITFSAPMAMALEPDVEGLTEGTRRVVWPVAYEWLNSTTLRVAMAVVDDPVRELASGVRITGALDQFGQAVAAVETPGLFDIDTLMDDVWQNPRQALDVNVDNLVTPLDALLIINELNARGPRALPVSRPSDESLAFPDTSGDGHVTPLDALLIINSLNASSTPANAEEPGSQAQWLAKTPEAISERVAYEQGASADLLFAGLWWLLDSD